MNRHSPDPPGSGAPHPPAAPILFPREHPIGLPPPDELTPAAQAQVQKWRARPAGRHGLAMYERHRRV